MRLKSLFEAKTLVELRCYNFSAQPEDIDIILLLVWWGFFWTACLFCNIGHFHLLTWHRIFKTGIIYCSKLPTARALPQGQWGKSVITQPGASQAVLCEFSSSPLPLTYSDPGDAEKPSWSACSSQGASTILFLQGRRMGAYSCSQLF